ncbi:MAG: hypothetical protein PHW85_03125 [Bacteroidales bacterium]|nr:hypothetical protein [Bacteroidales bacterium]MDD3911545.1 hypothetical protein [Bacteroidales bacterium]MDD4420566.1 hypothetical protein [Bacteroidales bacterium]
MVRRYFTYLLVACVTAVSLNACVKNQTRVVNQIVADSAYLGTLYVDKSYTQDSTIIFLEFPEESDKANLTLVNVRLSSSETEYHTIAISDLSYNAASAIITLKGDNIIPTVSGEDDSELTVKSLEVTVDSSTDPERIVFTMTMGTHDVSYSGELVYKKYIE